MRRERNFELRQGSSRRRVAENPDAPWYTNRGVERPVNLGEFEGVEGQERARSNEVITEPSWGRDKRDEMTRHAKRREAILRRKASKALLLAEAIMPKASSTEEVDRQAVDFMEMSMGSIQSSLERLAKSCKEDSKEDKKEPKEKKEEAKEAKKVEPEKKVAPKKAASPKKVVKAEEEEEIEESEEDEMEDFSDESDESEFDMGSSPEIGDIGLTEDVLDDIIDEAVEGGEKEESDMGDSMEDSMGSDSGITLESLASMVQDLVQKVDSLLSKEDSEVVDESPVEEEKEEPSEDLVDESVDEGSEDISFEDEGSEDEDVVEASVISNRKTVDAIFEDLLKSKTSSKKTKKASTGVKSLKKVISSSKETKDVSLDSLWPTAPDVSEYFGNRR